MVETSVPGLQKVKKCNFSDMDHGYLQMRLEGEMELEISCYNDKLAVWEPLLEPVMVTEGHYRPWEVLFKVRSATHRPLLGVQPQACAFFYPCSCP